MCLLEDGRRGGFGVGGSGVASPMDGQPIIVNEESI